VTQPWAPHCVVAKAANKQAEIRIYPPYGNSPSEAHSFAYRGAGSWVYGAKALSVPGPALPTPYPEKRNHNSDEGKQYSKANGGTHVRKSKSDTR
jgi:hypothetical protein